MDNLWAILAEITLTQALHLPTASAKCPENHYGEDFACRICAELPPGGSTLVDPVVVYRLWNKYHQDAMEWLHFPTPWRIVEPFLRLHGYRLKVRADCPPGPLAPDGSALDPCGLLFSPVSALERDEDMPGYSAHTYPAFNREGALVYIKTVPLQSPEFEVWRALSTEPLRSDPRNHSVPVVDVMIFRPDFAAFGYENQATDARAFVVMKAVEPLGPPMLLSQPHPIYPSLKNLYDIQVVMLQLAQGVHFMHQQGLAHLDIAARNVLWEGVHPKRRYYLIDYQYSRDFREHSGGAPSVSEVFCSVPEYRAEHKDPYAADVYCFGAMMNCVLDVVELGARDYQECPELIPLRAVANGMLQENPTHRLSMGAAEHDISQWIDSCEFLESLPIRSAE